MYPGEDLILPHFFMVWVRLRELLPEGPCMGRQAISGMQDKFIPMSQIIVGALITQTRTLFIRVCLSILPIILRHLHGGSAI
ncbi:hypothetical protein D3C71_1159570 [compost metagenome]